MTQALGDIEGLLDAEDILQNDVTVAGETIHNTIDLCALTHFDWIPVVDSEGFSSLQLVSRYPTYVRNDNRGNRAANEECQHICAELVFNQAAGVLQVATVSRGFLSVGGFAPVDGVIRGLVRGTIRGTVTIWSSGTHYRALIAAGGPGAEVGCSGIPGSTHGSPPPNTDAGCNWFPGDGNGKDCIYCFEDENDLSISEAVCTIEQEPYVPCSPNSTSVRVPSPAYGARVVPADKGQKDVFGNKQPFFAKEVVKYFLQAVIKADVDPVLSPVEGPTLGPRCTWLCNFVIHNQGNFSWQLVCIEPIQRKYPFQANQRQGRRFEVSLGNHIVYVHFNFQPHATCFQLADQACFTAGVGRNPHDYWTHTYSAPKLGALDSIRLDAQTRIASDAERDPDHTRYPYDEPECRDIVNDALSQLNDYNFILEPASRTHAYNYNSASINAWSTQKAWSCEKAPPVRRGGHGEPWTVYVWPYGSDCRIPADLVLRKATMSLRLSVEPGPPAPAGTPGHFGFIRLAATFSCTVELDVRLRPGWEAHGCPLMLTPTNRCDGRFVDTSLARVVARDGCSIVPTAIRWHGMRGPRPFGRSFDFEERGASAVDCCDVLRVIHGQVIPGEGNDLVNPDGPQRFAGDVYIELATPPQTVGCA